MSAYMLYLTDNRVFSLEANKVLLAVRAFQANEVLLSVSALLANR